VSQFVLDASVVLTWCFPDEASQKAEEISERIASGDRIVVSAFWRYEVLNALLVGERRKRITPALTQASLMIWIGCRWMWMFRQARPQFHRDAVTLPQAWPNGIRCALLGNSDARNEDTGDSGRRFEAGGSC
jgi:hypothetical protein